jgi:hypothetical protein
MMRLLFAVAVLFLSQTMSGQNTISNLFREMPDSILPTLTRNNRLDMIDFMDARMQAEITNKLDGKSEMKTLTSDSLLLRMSASTDVTLLLLDVVEPVDSSLQVVCMVRTYRLASGQGEEHAFSYYSSSWRKLTEQPQLSERSLARVRSYPPSTILNVFSTEK